MAAWLVFLLLQSAYPTPPPHVNLLLAMTAQDDQERDGPDPHPLPMHGPYEHARGWTCWKLETNEAHQVVHCACKMRCENNGQEDHSCLTSCAGAKCRCHPDADCDAPLVEPGK